MSSVSSHWVLWGRKSSSPQAWFQLCPVRRDADADADADTDADAAVGGFSEGILCACVQLLAASIAHLFCLDKFKQRAREDARKDA